MLIKLSNFVTEFLYAYNTQKNPTNKVEFSKFLFKIMPKTTYLLDLSIF